MTETARRWLALPAVAALLALALVGNALARPRIATGGASAVGSTVGRAGFAYLTGLRVFAADLLWNRLDPQMHEYYGGHIGLGHMRFMLPNFYVINWLDPQFVDTYYVGPEILVENGRLEQALALAKEGVDNNPHSGLLIVSWAQYEFEKAHHLGDAVLLADRATRADTVWRSDEEKWDSYAIVKAIYDKAGLKGKASAVQAVKDAISANPNATTTPADSDKTN